MNDTEQYPEMPEGTEPAVEKAKEFGHTVEWDPPAALTRARRWTCSVRSCGATVIDYLGNIYGSAVERACTEEA